MTVLRRPTESSLLYVDSGVHKARTMFVSHYIECCSGRVRYVTGVLFATSDIDIYTSSYQEYEDRHLFSTRHVVMFHLSSHSYTV